MSETARSEVIIEGGEKTVWSKIGKEAPPKSKPEKGKTQNSGSNRGSSRENRDA